MRSSWSIWVDLKFNDKRPPRDTQGMDKRGRGNVTTEAKIRVMQPQAQKCPEPPEARSGKKQNLPESLKMKLALPPRFWASGFQSCERIKFYYFILPCLLSVSYWSHRKLLHYPSAICNRLYIPWTRTIFCVFCGLHFFNLV